MILKDLLDVARIGSAPIEIRSAYNDKLLCKRFNAKKHETLLDREVVGVIPEIRCANGMAFPVLFVYLNGQEELLAELGAKTDGDRE